METKYFLGAPECLKLLGFEKFFDNFLRFMGYTKTNHIANADKIFLVMCKWINESERSKKLSEINAEKALWPLSMLLHVPIVKISKEKQSEKCGYAILKTL